MNSWFRMYNEVHSDPKVQLLPPVLFKAWINLMCLANMNEDVLPSPADIAFRLHISTAKATQFVDDLIEKRLFEKRSDGKIEPHNWENRQFRSDTSTERVERYRDKRRALGLPILSDYSKFKPELIKRDGAQCIYCEISGPLVVDHIVPIELGGTDHIDNLALACKPCNSGKAGRTPELAGMTIRVSTALAAYHRYRDTHSVVTVTGNKSERLPDSDTEQRQIQNREEGSGSGLKNAGTRPPDPAFEIFAKKHHEFTGTAYVPKTADFVQLAKLRKANRVEAKIVPDQWEQANDNFFGSPMSAYSFADLCVRYPIFRNSSLNEFKNPVHHRGNGNGRESSQERAIRENKETAERLHRLLGDTTGDGAGPEDSSGTDVALRGGPK